MGVAISSTFAGALLGTLIHNWVRVDIVPIGVSEARVRVHAHVHVCVLLPLSDG